MTKSRFFGTAFSIVLVLMAVAASANAQASRTWVSGVGDDANPCSRTAPCKTFAGAISKTADGGEIDALDPAGYGAVTITKGITIDGGCFASILVSGTNAIVINDSTQTKVIVIRNISFDGIGTGLDAIRFLAGKALYVEHCVINGFTGNGIAMVPGTAASGGTFGYIDDVDIINPKGASNIGVKLSAGTSGLFVSMDDVHVQRGLKGVEVGSNSFITLRNSIIDDVTTGVEMVNGSAGGTRAGIENTMINDCTTGLAAGSGTTTLLSQTSIIFNTTGISNGGGTVQSSGNNRILGNSSDGLTPTIINPK